MAAFIEYLFGSLRTFRGDLGPTGIFQAVHSNPDLLTSRFNNGKISMKYLTFILFKNMKKGICAKKRRFFGLISVTSKGQIAVPAELRRELGIREGDKLMVVKRSDGLGLNLLKSESIDGFIDKISKD